MGILKDVHLALLESVGAFTCSTTFLLVTGTVGIVTSAGGTSPHTHPPGRSERLHETIMKFSTLSLVSGLAATAAQAQWHDWAPPHRGGNQCRGMWHMPGRDYQNVPTMGNSTFAQPIDHEDPSLGTFEQWYMYDTTYYGGPGSPIVLFTPGEVNATGYTSYLTKNRTTGVLAEKIGAAVIVLEHRYWGTSTPYVCTFHLIETKWHMR